MLSAWLAVCVPAMAAPISLQSPLALPELPASVAPQFTSVELEFPDSPESVLQTQPDSAKIVTTLPPGAMALEEAEAVPGGRVPEPPTGVSSALAMGIILAAVGLRQKILLERRHPGRRRRPYICRLLA